MSLSEKEPVGASATLSSKVFNALRRDILLGVYKPGQKLLLNELKARYEVGGSPIREALLQLSWHKYVVMEPQRGFWVAPISLDELRDILFVRRALAEQAVRRSLEQGDEAWELAVLSSYHRLSRMDLANPAVDLQDWADRHMAFHLAIINGGHSPLIIDLMESLYNRLERYRHIWFDPSLPSGLRYSDEGEHQAIMQAVLARDVARTMELLDQHYSHIMTVAEGLTAESFPKQASQAV
ncbi:GntR family transcriptional regulator [Chromobacterium sp. IIBBL 290-4]|uniref:GntR family transcriptional regulator n=1 Tax=Chromobacterium sp. IIBBL 290-4 TaxID=2953890 RepID=UPI0020B73165|nr:FCD domain-containing protein [Chromobacterium sp. IIBBL 290-4]UTH72337.1 FCD domain-containing protein [Chromobacterium sp. IIBBL 290-4]